MAMTTCRECEGALSSEAPACPHCGAPNDQPTATSGDGRPPKLWLIAAALLVGVLGLGWAVFGGGEPLAERDPAGADACEKLAFSLERENTAVALGSSLGAAQAADLADTDSIRESVIDPSEGIDLPAGVDRDALLIPDTKKLHAACEDEGVDMPPLKEPAS